MDETKRLQRTIRRIVLITVPIMLIQLAIIVWFGVRNADLRVDLATVTTSLESLEAVNNAIWIERLAELGFRLSGDTIEFSQVFAKGVEKQTQEVHDE